MKKSIFRKKHLPLLIAFLLGALLFFTLARHAVSQSKVSDFHEHADFAVFIDGVQFDFTKEKYMSLEPCLAYIPSLFPSAYAHGGSGEPEGRDLRDFIHLHGGIGTVIHAHKEGVTYENFFESLGMDFHDTYLEDDEWHRYDNTDEKEWVFFLNGERVDGLAETEIRNLDKVLFSYGKKIPWGALSGNISDGIPTGLGSLGEKAWRDILTEYGQVTNMACIASEACTHREPLAKENCGASNAKGFLERLLGL